MGNYNILNLKTMRVREFFVRIGLFLPMTVFGILFILMLFGIGADLIGAESLFYCTVYCKVCVAALALGGLYCVYCQARACCRKKE